MLPAGNEASGQCKCLQGFGRIHRIQPELIPGFLKSNQLWKNLGFAIDPGL
jgi:hypothetical protein